MVTDVDDELEKDVDADKMPVILGKPLSDAIEAVGSCVGLCEIDDDPLVDILAMAVLDQSDENDSAEETDLRADGLTDIVLVTERLAISVDTGELVIVTEPVFD